MADDLRALTPRQLDIFEFLVAHIREHGYGPTVREIGHEFAIKSPNGVMCHIRALVKKGWIEVAPNVSRGVHLLVGEVCPHCKGLGRTGDPILA